MKSPSTIEQQVSFLEQKMKMRMRNAKMILLFALVAAAALLTATYFGVVPKEYSISLGLVCIFIICISSVEYNNNKRTPHT
jgi:hypothetical protein